MKRDELCHVVLSLLIVLIEPILQDFSALFNCAFRKTVKELLKITGNFIIMAICM